MKDDKEIPLFSPWDLLPFAGLGAAWLWLQHWLPQLPQRVPSHWNAAGRIDGWMDKDFLFVPPLALALLFWILFFLIGAATRRSADAQRRAGARATLPLRGLMPMGIALMLAYVMPMAALHGGSSVVLPAFLILGGCLAVGLILMVRELRRTPLPPGHRPEDYRMGGAFYKSERDPRLWVPKRMGVGWTLNFAHPMAWPMLILLLSPAIIAVIFAIRTLK